MDHSFRITSHPVELGGGWKLQLLEDDEEVGGGIFPIKQTDPKIGMAWWNALTEVDRGRWLNTACSAKPADAYHAFLRLEAHAKASTEGYVWLDSRKK